jgi:hypothetical protein
MLTCESIADMEIRIRGIFVGRISAVRAGQRVLSL